MLTVRTLCAIAWLIGLPGWSVYGSELGKADAPSLAILERALESASSIDRAEHASVQCPSSAEQPWPGLLIRDGRVQRAQVLDEIEGYAKSAGTTGGLGGDLAIVTTVADYVPKHEPVVPGSLRALVAEADGHPRWIVFSPALGANATINLKQDIRLPDNITVDGSCADVTLQSSVSEGGLYVFSTRNVVISHLRLRKTDYVSTTQKAGIRTALRLNGAFDAIAILHNDLSECGDGCIDITVSPNHPIPDRARVTVAFNRIADHDKTMLFGIFDCNHPELGTPMCDADYFARYKDAEPHLFLTLQGNLFLRTAQRHPRIFGRVRADVVNNVIAYEPHVRSGGGESASYGTVVLDTARALVEGNVYVPMTPENARHLPNSVFTASTNGSLWQHEVDGFIRLGTDVAANITAHPSVLAENQPDRVPESPAAARTEVLSVAQLGLERSIRCIAARAGRLGTDSWKDAQCSVARP